MHLVTGGAGFIGSHIAARLVARGDAVRVLDNCSTGKRANLAEIADRIDYLEGDIRNAATVRAAMEGVTTVFHHAAEVSVPRSMDDPVAAYDINVAGFLSVLVAARAAGVSRVVFASSSAVYGDDPRMPKDEAMAPAPISPYASSKLAGEHLCAVFTKAYGLEAIALRYFNVFGPRQDPNSAYAAVIPRFLHAADRGERPTIFGDGGQSRDFVFIDDVVDANLLAATATEIGGRVFNVASGSAVSLNQAWTAISALTGGDLRPIHQPERAGDVRHSLADISRARQELGYAPSTPFAEGLRRTLASLGGARADVAAFR